MDKFGLTYSLNHEDKYEFHTVPGGLMSTILYFIVVSTTIILTIRMVYRQEVQTEVKNVDNQLIFSNETVTPFENNKFMIAFGYFIRGLNHEYS